MPLANSPKLEYTPDGKPREQINWRQYVVRGLIGVLLLAALGLTVYSWAAGNLVNRLAGTDGNVRGIVLDAQGQPLANALVFVVRAPSTITPAAADGTFNLSNMPTGEQTLVVVYNDIGQEFAVTVQQSAPTDVGAVSYIASPEH